MTTEYLRQVSEGFTMNKTGYVPDNSSDSKNYSNQASISQCLSAVYPSQENNGTGFEMANNRAADWTCFVDNHELGKVDETCQRTALGLISHA